MLFDPSKKQRGIALGKRTDDSTQPTGPTFSQLLLTTVLQFWMFGNCSKIAVFSRGLTCRQILLKETLLFGFNTIEESSGQFNSIA